MNRSAVRLGLRVRDIAPLDEEQAKRIGTIVDIDEDGDPGIQWDGDDFSDFYLAKYIDLVPPRTDPTPIRAHA